MTNIDKLEALAKAATPGPWRGDRIDGTVKYDIVAGDYPNGDHTVVCHGDNGNACDGGYGFTSAENEDYVLAANPAAILELIAEVRALRTRLEINPRHQYDGIHCRDETIRQLEGEVRELREVLNTPLLTGADAPMYGGIFCAEGVNRDTAMSAFYSGAPTVTVYYGTKRVFTCMAEFEEARAKEEA